METYQFRYGQYRDKKWWSKIRVKCLKEHRSINELIVILLDAWLNGEIEIKAEKQEKEGE